jgi:hypothetical protein
MGWTPPPSFFDFSKVQWQPSYSIATCHGAVRFLSLAFCTSPLPHLDSSSASCFHYASFEYRGSLMFPSFFWTVLFSHCLVTCHLCRVPLTCRVLTIPSRFLVAFLFIPPPPRKASPARSRRCIGIGLLNMAANGSAFVL